MWEIKRKYGTVNLKFKFLFVCEGDKSPPPSFFLIFYTYLNEIFKIVIQSKKLIQNNERNFDKTICKKRTDSTHFGPILHRTEHCLHILTNYNNVL